MEEEYEQTLWERIEPTVYGISMLVMNVGLVVAGLAALYLLINLFGGGVASYTSQPAAQQKHILDLIAVAGKAVQIGIVAAAIGAGIAFRTEEATGYSLLGGAAALGLGLPYAVHSFADASTSNKAGVAILGIFIAASYVPGVIGLILVIRDVVLRGISAVGDKSVDKSKMTYGTGAEADRLPTRTSIIAKCWEGGFCRDFIRPHCPIFLSRKTCWKEKRGCYCEEEIVSSAASKVQGVVLEMAPEAKYNFANAATPAGASAIGGGSVQSQANMFRKPVLSAAQKRERCRNCVIYNEHEKEKYKILLPVTALGGIALCVMFAVPMRKFVDVALSTTQTIINKTTFQVGGAPQIVHPGETVEWIFVVVFGIMLMSKLLQGLEWACFKAKI